jgi:hypothetical protein
MNRATAELLIRQYFQSWLQQDISLFLSTLSPSIEIVECYGPAYRGLDETQRWFHHWHTRPEKGKVTRWDILRLTYDEDRKLPPSNGISNVFTMGARVPSWAQACLLLITQR